MRDNEWGIARLLLIYVGIIGTLVLAVAYGLTKVTIASEQFGQRVEPGKTVLDERIAIARNIKRALSQPIPPPEPLPPITAQPANMPQTKVGTTERASKEKTAKRKVPAAALDAMAMGDSLPSSPQLHSPSVDRGSSGGW